MMIQAKTIRKNEKIQEIFVSGHANYKPHGEDIVCAAVSTATLITANAIEHFGLKDLIHLTIKEGHFKLTVEQDHDIIMKLLENLEFTLLDLEKQYPKYIKIKKEG